MKKDIFKIAGKLLKSRLIVELINTEASKKPLMQLQLQVLT